MEVRIMADKQQPAEHPQVAFTQAEYEERAKAAKAPPPPPHPAQVIAETLGTDPSKLDREAWAEYRAGHPKKAAAAQAATTEAEPKK
jgi:hypothetical protein